MTRGRATSPTSSAAIVVALVAATAVGGVLGYFAGSPVGREATRRTIRLQELPMGAAGRPIALELVPPAAGPVRNVVLLIGDGLGIAQLQAARLAAFGPDGRFVAERFPVVGLARTSAIGLPVTNSAASGTALATGVATDQERIAEAPDGRALRTLLEAARDAGFATGLVTTSSICDATPASFAAHVDDRDRLSDVALQLAAARIDLLVGGGLEQFRPWTSGGRRFDRRDLIAEAKGRGVTIASDAAELAAASHLPLWALVEGRLDRPGGDPPLSTWTERALELLSTATAPREHGFFLMVEEEGVDSAGHANDYTALTRALLRIDGAVAAAARFAAKDGATLVIVTGDHATGGLEVDSTSDPRRARVGWGSIKHSGEPVPVFAYGPADAALRFGGSFSQREIPRRIAELLGLDLSANWKGTP